MGNALHWIDVVLALSFVLVLCSSNYRRMRSRVVNVEVDGVRSKVRYGSFRFVARWTLYKR
jgi:hypothetical protein